jgi:predicted secreted hydrolase
VTAGPPAISSLSPTYPGANMSDKFLLPNLGIPLFVDPEKNLPATPKASMDSWYVISTFEADGKQIGFEWHQGLIAVNETLKVSSTEFLLMNGTDQVWIDNALDEPAVGEIGSSAEVCHVQSSFGTLKGGLDKLELALSVDRGGVDVVFTPKSEVLYNGTTGLVALLGYERDAALLTGSYQFAFPNMDVQGTVTIDGDVHEIQNATAWFDRQWGCGSPEILDPKAGASTAAWLWIGTPLNEASTAAISLWDMFIDGTRRSFATILDEHGVQTNYLVNLGYEQIWTSERTGNSYPREIHVSVPSADLTMSFQAMFDEPEFDHGQQMINGCQSLSEMTGTYRGVPIERHVIVEMIGNLCG